MRDARSFASLSLCVVACACSRTSAPANVGAPSSTSNAPSASVAATTPEAAFWRWFVAHQGDVAKIEKGDEPIADELADELKKVDPGLTFEIGVGTKTTSGTRELIVSADGIQSVFPAVKRLVAAAPSVDGWTFIAFRPRKSDAFEIEVGGTKISAKSITFRVVSKSADKVDIALYIKGAATVDDQVKQATYLLLDGVVGEYDVETYLGGIDMLPGSSAPPGTKPLSELPGVVDAMK